MSYYDSDDLRDFVKYSKEYLAGLPEEEKKDKESIDKVKELYKIIISLYYNAMLFEDYIKGYSASDYLLADDLSQLPLHINDEGLLSQVIVKWRLERNK